MKWFRLTMDAALWQERARAAGMDGLAEMFAACERVFHSAFDAAVPGA